MQLFRTFVLAAMGVFCVVAHAQWQWVDNAGRKVFSDQPPPTDIPAKNILKQPRNAPAPAVATPVAAPSGTASAAVAAAAPPLSKDDRELLDKKKKAEAQAAEQRYLYYRRPVERDQALRQQFRSQEPQRAFEDVPAHVHRLRPSVLGDDAQSPELPVSRRPAH